MSLLRENSVEKSPVEEKASLEEHDSSSSQGDAEQTALGYGTRKVTPKAKLPYGWQLLMVVLTCLCTCRFIHHCCVVRRLI